MKDISSSVETLLSLSTSLKCAAMPNDAKLGLVIGLGLVIAVAVIYFRGDSAGRKEETASTAVKPAATYRQPAPRGQSRPTKARPAVQTEGGEPEDATATTDEASSNREP
jgi:hypothetical protein